LAGHILQVEVILHLLLIFILNKISNKLVGKPTLGRLIRQLAGGLGWGWLGRLIGRPVCCSCHSDTLRTVAETIVFYLLVTAGAGCSKPAC